MAWQTVSTQHYPNSHIQAAIMEQLEEENRRLRLELKAVRAELQEYKQRKPINLDEKFVDKMLKEIHDEKKEEKKEPDWDKIDHSLRTRNVGYIKDLITKNEINLDATDSGHQDTTLLMKASIFGNYDIVELLIHSEANINLKSKENNLTALDYAEKWANYHISQLLEFEELGASLGSKVKNTINTLHRQNGITQCALNNLSKDTLDSIVTFIMYCIENKLPFSDDMMHIAWSHINKQDAKPIDSGLFQRLLSIYHKIIYNPSNKRDWSWLENYLISSTIWLNTYPHDNTRTLFNELFIGADEANQTLSKQLLLGHITEMRTKHGLLWKELKKFTVKNCENPMGSNSVSIIRQDEIENGIKAEYTKKELLRNKPFGTNFNPLHHYDLNEYLNKLFFRATIVDDTFQNDVENIMKEIIFNDNAIKVHYKRGPIKLIKRCIDKIEHKYSLQEFPTSAHLLDINRCSLTFHDLPSMIKGIKQFINMINTGNYCIKQVVRCKNGWNSTDFTDSNPTYSDIKLNVMIDIGNGICIIGEIQILLLLMERFKVRAHQYYNIFRQQEFIGNYIDIAPLMMDKQYQLFNNACNGDRKSLLNFIVTYNISSTELLAMAQHKKSGKTIVSKICEFNHYKLFKLLQSLVGREEFEHILQLKDKTGEQWCPIGEALNANSKDVIDILCKEYPKLMLNFHSKINGKHLLHFVAQNGNVQCLKWYLEKIKNNSFENKKQILMVKDINGYTPLVVACNHSQIEIIKYLMEWSNIYNLQKDIVKIKDNEGCNTSLMLCCYKGNEKCVECLLSNINDQQLRLEIILDVDKKGLTPLIYAALSHNMHSAIQCAQILINYISDSQQRLRYIEHRSNANYGNKNAQNWTSNENLKIQLKRWVSNAQKR